MFSINLGRVASEHIEIDRLDSTNGTAYTINLCHIDKLLAQTAWCSNDLAWRLRLNEEQASAPVCKMRTDSAEMIKLSDRKIMRIGGLEHVFIVHPKSGLFIKTWPISSGFRPPTSTWIWRNKLLIPMAVGLSGFSVPSLETAVCRAFKAVTQRSGPGAKTKTEVSLVDWRHSFAWWSCFSNDDT